MKLKNYANKYTVERSRNIKKNWKYKIILDKIKKNSKVLDVGLGSGVLMQMLKGKCDYYAVDYNEHIVDYWKKKNFNVKRCDVAKETLPFKDNFFDIVWCSHIVEHIHSEEQIRFFKELYRILKKGGFLIVFSPTPFNWYFWDDLTHTRPCTHKQLEDLALNAGFSSADSKYSLFRAFPKRIQTYFRLPPFRFFIWEVYLIAKK